MRPSCTLQQSLPLFIILIAALCLAGGHAFAGDWPTFRHDNSRSATTIEDLQPPLALQWTFTPQHGPEPQGPHL